jgi:hypothetical protein
MGELLKSARLESKKSFELPKEWYSETNPIEINMPDEKSLADKLD